jgi:hypothetical protein
VWSYGFDNCLLSMKSGKKTGKDGAGLSYAMINCCYAFRFVIVVIDEMAPHDIKKNYTKTANNEG